MRSYKHILTLALVASGTCGCALSPQSQLPEATAVADRADSLTILKSGVDCTTSRAVHTQDAVELFWRRMVALSSSYSESHSSGVIQSARMRDLAKREPLCMWVDESANALVLRVREPWTFGLSAKDPFVRVALEGGGAHVITIDGDSNLETGWRVGRAFSDYTEVIDLGDVNVIDGCVTVELVFFEQCDLDDDVVQVDRHEVHKLFKELPVVDRAVGMKSDDSDKRITADLLNIVPKLSITLDGPLNRSAIHSAHIQLPGFEWKTFRGRSNALMIEVVVDGETVASGTITGVWDEGTRPAFVRLSESPHFEGDMGVELQIQDWVTLWKLVKSGAKPTVRLSSPPKAAARDPVRLIRWNEQALYSPRVEVSLKGNKPFITLP